MTSTEFAAIDRDKSPLLNADRSLRESYHRMSVPRRTARPDELASAFLLLAPHLPSAAGKA